MSGVAASQIQPASPLVSRLGVVVLAGLAFAALALGIFGGRDALAGWLAAATFWAGFPIGALVVLMIMRLVPGTWTEELGPAMTALLPILLPIALAFVAVVVGAGTLYPWAGAAQRTAFRAAYFSIPFFAARTVIWLAISGLLAWLLRSGRTSSPALPCIGLIAWAVGGTVVATDWLQSLDPELNSSGFGLYVLVSWSVVAMAGGVLLAVQAGTVERPGVLGALLLTTLLLWAYLAFMPFVIIWSGNLPAGVRWYAERRDGVWAVLLWAYVLLGAVPLTLLILPPVMRSRAWLGPLAAAALAAKTLEFAWLALPGHGVIAGWSFIVSHVVIGAGCCTVAARFRERVPT